ncbi:hypothetical protein [Streptomyces sp. 6N223]|uniref:hypothetical protein n=1 Tax=Streptomyces sp. 6N223 TaxID=3457412 RepID=UPI003FD47216
MNTSPFRALGTSGLAAALALIPASAALAWDVPAGPAGDHHGTEHGTQVAPHAGPYAGDKLGDDSGAAPEAQLREVRRATVRYQDVRLAEADGYTMGESCIPGLGYHFVREVAEGPEQLAITEPNSVVYAPQEDGSLKLVAVGYVSKRPASLLGQEFSPPAILPYYTLHAWAWEENPDGTFEHINPNITCPGKEE